MTQQPTTNEGGRSPTRISICQQNINKMLIVQEDLLHRLKPKQYDIAAIQEPYLNHHHNSRTSPHWYTVYPKEHYINLEKMWTIILVNRRISTDSWTQIDFHSSDITVIQIQMEAGKALIINTYNDIAHLGTI